MQAIRVEQFGGPEVMRVKDVPVPQPGPGQVLIRVHAAGVNPVDTYIRAGLYPQRPALPFTPGMDGAGVVESVGEGVAKYSRGVHVYIAGSISGTYADYALCDVSQVHRLPDAVPFAQGAALGIPYTTARCALIHRGNARAGETVLVHGASGGTGVAAVQMAHAEGLNVFATASTEQARQMLTDLGAAAVFDHSAPDYREKIKAAAADGGVHLILEMLANVNLPHDVTLIAPRGRIVIIGSRGPVEINPRELMARDAEVRGMLIFNATSSELADAHAAILRGLENASLRPVIGREFPLAEAAAAHETVMQSGACGKIVLTTGG